MIGDKLFSVPAGYGMTGVQFLAQNGIVVPTGSEVSPFHQSPHAVHYLQHRASCFTATTHGEVAPPPFMLHAATMYDGWRYSSKHSQLRH